MSIQSEVNGMTLALRMAALLLPLAAFAQQPDFNYYRTKVEPIFTTKRPTHARCIVCHIGRTSFNLQPLAKGVSTYTEAESRKNYDMLLKNVVNVSKPEVSPLLMHPLAEAGGGDEFHSGGRQFMDQKDPNWKAINDWIRGAK
jgi:hypothetical protein